MIVRGITLCLFFLKSIYSQSIEVTYSRDGLSPLQKPRVYLALVSEKTRHAPRIKMTDWSDLPILFSLVDEDGDGKVVFSGDHQGSEKTLNRVEGKIQAIVRLNERWFVAGQGDGDLFSDVEKWDPKSVQTMNLRAEHVVKWPKIRTEGKIRDGKLRSQCLSEFHEKPMEMNYTVLLPKGWEPEKKYPVLVYLLGYTGFCRDVPSYVRFSFGSGLDEFLCYIVDANCYHGHSVMADSVVNGPWGRALTEELLPALDQKYGGIGASQRYVTGVSSGGWASLWLQVNYPKCFASAWGFSPDPLDFRDFLGLNLYSEKPQSLYWDESGKKRRLAREGSGIDLLNENFGAWEQVHGPGGQLHSLGAVFAPRLVNGELPEWYDHKNSGMLNMDIVKQWEPFDLSKCLEKAWKKDPTQLLGKIHVSCQEEDMFYLDASVRLFQQKCQEIGCDAQITFTPGLGHHMTYKAGQEILAVMRRRAKKELLIQSGSR